MPSCLRVPHARQRLGQFAEARTSLLQSRKLAPVSERAMIDAHVVELEQQQHMHERDTSIRAARMSGGHAAMDAAIASLHGLGDVTALKALVVDTDTQDACRALNGLPALLSLAAAADTPGAGMHGHAWL